MLPVAVTVPVTLIFDETFILPKLPVVPCTFPTNQLASIFPVNVALVPEMFPVKLAVTLPPPIIIFDVLKFVTVAEVMFAVVEFKVVAYQLLTFPVLDVMLDISVKYPPVITALAVLKLVIFPVAMLALDEFITVVYHALEFPVFTVILDNPSKYPPLITALAVYKFEVNNDPDMFAEVALSVVTYKSPTLLVVAVRLDRLLI